MEIVDESFEKFENMFAFLTDIKEIPSNCNRAEKGDKLNVIREHFRDNKIHFLSLYGKYLLLEHLKMFEEFFDDSNVGLQINNAVSYLIQSYNSDKHRKINVQSKNRRFEALKELIAENSYFSETEMMKRNPLLYEQMIGRYLSEPERRARDKPKETDTFVKILMEGIERDDARELKRKQEEVEPMDDDDDDEDEDLTDGDDTQNEETKSDQKPGFSQWGEFTQPERKNDQINKEEFQNHANASSISEEKKSILRDEFVTIMYESFLEGNDKDFDYQSVDNNEKYDNLELLNQDLEDKYFDSEEANEDALPVSANESGPSSEDDLDIFMETLQRHHPSVTQLSNHFKKL